ncbi:MAG: hypothetical protein M3355_10255 [Actinomycetota bacterium]|nr:hypothetical protein [Actinomycetota bacterium]
MLPAKAWLTRRAPIVALRPLALVLAAAALVAAGCGDEEESTSSDPDAGSNSLTIALDPDGPGGPDEELSEQVFCDGGNDSACAAIEDLEASDFDPPSDQACTEIFGGPDIARIEGTIDGEDVNAELTRANGCEIERFDRVVPLLQALFEGYEPGAAIEAPVAG